MKKGDHCLVVFLKCDRGLVVFENAIGFLLFLKRRSLLIYCNS